MAMIRRNTVRSIWQVIFALTALLEAQYIILLMRKNVDESYNEPESNEYCRTTKANYYEDSEFSINYNFMDWVWESTLEISQLVFVWAGPFFCSLCLVEALIRAVEARKAALDNRALDDLEKKLLRAAQMSSVKLSFFFLGPAADQQNRNKRSKAVSKALRSWIPPIATIAFWLFILPTDISDFRHRCGSESLGDSAVVTRWINRMSLSVSDLISVFHSLVESFFWTKILPYRIHKEPQRFIQRLQVILRFLRWLRFAGPFFRMTLKLQDQIRAVWKTRWQSRTSEKEKQRRIDKPTMIFTDIQKLLQLAKAQTAIARVPSFQFPSSPRLDKISSSVMEQYNKRREYGKKISEQLTKLQNDFGANDSFSATSDIYDRIVKISQDITTSINSQRRNYSHRYVKAIRGLLSSRRHLISPRSRFSLAWRMTVTNCLLLEIARLCASWYLSETFSISLSQIVGKLLIHCKEPEQVKHHLAFITDQINQFRHRMFDMLPIFGPPPVDIAVCIPNGPHTVLLLTFGRMLEFFVDAVVFMDIFVWFLTGDIDFDTHSIIPKPFFTRCILPGTLVQVLDHPTLPGLLPGLLNSTLATVSTIGYSRCIRWILALVPALKILAIDPLAGYFFEHIEKDEGLMHYAESVGMLTPERKKGSGLFFGSAESLGAPGGNMNKSYSHSRQSGDNAFNTSQVGLSIEASPITSRAFFLPRMISSTDGSSSNIVERLPPPSLISMENSPLKKHKSVHFGLFGDVKEEIGNSEEYSLQHPTLVSSDESQTTASANEEEIDKSVGYLLSCNELHTSLSSIKIHNHDIQTSREEIGESIGYSLSAASYENISNDESQITKPTVKEEIDENGGIDKSVGCPLSCNELHATLSSDNICNDGSRRE